MNQPLRLKVWGDFACFTRPEMKAERVSYDVITPSAARGVLEAIFWKPEFYWRVQSVRILNPIKRISIRRSEVNSKASERVARKWAEKDPAGAYYCNQDHTQRSTLALRNVAYLIEADIELKPHSDDNPAKYRDQFRRRVARGQYFHHPYLGCREFGASFAEPDGSEQAIDLSEDLGRMLFDVDYRGAKNDQYVPIFFDAKLDHGVLHIPQELYHREEL
jgi:CRISPR-associated protein Cas5d